MEEPRIRPGQIRFSSEDQLRNAAIVREFVEGRHAGAERFETYLDPECRIFFDTNPGDAIYYGNKCFGVDFVKKSYEDFGGSKVSYDITIHSITTNGPLVVVSRTDVRKEEGKDDIAIPAVGVFAFKGGKIVEWSDYYR